MIGDSFLKDTFLTLKEIHVTALRGEKPMPYILQHYNMDAFTAPTAPLVRSFFAQMTNALAMGLNDQMRPPHLPRYVLIMMDKDFIENINIFDYGAAQAFKDMMKWLLINLNNLIETRKSDLVSKCPRVVSTSPEPRLIWVQMIRRPDTSAKKEVFALTRKFNNIPEKVISKDKWSHILKIFVECSQGNFDQWGNLTPRGKHNYWRVLDSTMKDFDIGETDLEPTHAMKDNGEPKESSREMHDHKQRNNFMHTRPYHGQHRHWWYKDSHQFHQHYWRPAGIGCL